MTGVAVLAANSWCPLTRVAARHTDGRRDCFDIDLPRWLARDNKHVLGTRFLPRMRYACSMPSRAGGGMPAADQPAGMT